MGPREEFRGTPRFSVVRRIGAGGMGVVYEALDRDRKETVALKTLRDVDPVSLYRFKQEFRSLAELSHPNLVPLHELVAGDTGDGATEWFFTMELVEGAVDFRAWLGAGVPEAHDSGSDETTTDMRTRQDIGAADHDHGPTVAGDGATLLTAHGSASAIPGSAAAGGTLPAMRADAARLRPLLRQLASGVQALHDAGKLHRDLKPSNVLVRPDGHVVLVDFGLVAELSETPAPREIEHPTPAGSPSRLTHQSTDRGLAGTIGFMSPEQAGRRPLTPASDWYAIGVMLFSALTGRLPFTGQAMAVLQGKQEREAPRPSNFAAGIPEDLESLCVDLLRLRPEDRPSGAEVLARLGVRAEAPRADRLPFIGRAQQLATLDAAYARMRAGDTVVCRVHGRSGAGKSALVGRFLSDLAAHGDGPVVLVGRCYEQESVPYKAIDSLVDALTHHLLGVPHEVSRTLVPSHAAELTRIFPVLNRVEAFARATRRGRPASDPREMRAQAFAGLRELLCRLGAAHPLVLCIDDVQWGDGDSADLLAGLVAAPGAPRLLLLLSYRDEYAATSVCLQRLDGQPGTRPADALDIEVGALSTDEARALARDLLGERPTAHADAEWIARESAGGAFFVYALVDRITRGVTTATGAAPLVLDTVLWERVSALDDVSRRLLEVIAIAGRPVPLALAQHAAHLPEVPTATVTALRHGRLIRTMGRGRQDGIETFHDRIRESIVAHLPAETIRHHHAGLAASLELAGQPDPETLAVHLEGAGQTGRASERYAEAAARAVTVLAFERAETLFRKAAALAPDDAARARIHERMIHFFTDLARFHDAYGVAREAVVPFGVSLPKSFVPPLFIADFVASKIRLRGRTVASLVELPAASDPKFITAVRLMAAVAKAAYQIRPELCVAVSTRIVNMCLARGNTPDCAIGYMVYGAIFQGGVLGNHPAGYDFGRLALALVSRNENAQQRAEVHFVVGYFGTSWLRPATDAEALWRTAYDAGLETGDLFHTGCASAASIMSAHMRGVPMAETAARGAELLDVLRRHQLREPIGAITAVLQAERALAGATAGPGDLGDAQVNEAALASDVASFGSRHFAHFYFIVKTEALYLAGRADEARHMAARSAAYLKDSPGMLHSAEHHFWAGLAHAAPGGTPRVVRGAHKKFAKWAAVNAENFLAKERILAGEVSRLSGRTADALAAFAAAEGAARQYGQLHIEALAARLAGRVFAATGRAADAAAAGARAADAYGRWGATALQSPQ